MFGVPSTLLLFLEYTWILDRATAFVKIFERCTKMEDLRFAGNRPTSKGSDLVASVLDASLCIGLHQNLKKLYLSDNEFKSKISRMELFRVLILAKSLTFLDLGGCDLEDDGIKDVCLALTHGHLILEHLDLSGNEITKHGAKHIADYIRENGGELKTLRLEDNLELTSTGVVIIASALHGSEDGRSIEEIKLNGCMMGAIGARALIDAYGPDGKNLPKLKNINLDDNSFANNVLSELMLAFDHKLGTFDLNDPDGDVDDEDELSDLAEGMVSLLV